MKNKIWRTLAYFIMLLIAVASTMLATIGPGISVLAIWQRFSPFWASVYTTILLIFSIMLIAFSSVTIAMTMQIILGIWRE